MENFKLERKEEEELRGLYPRLEAQIMHMGKCRGKNSNQIDLEDVRKAHAWCERNLKQFITENPPIYRTAWEAGQFDETSAEAGIQLGPVSPPSTSSHPTMHLSITASNNPK